MRYDQYRRTSLAVGFQASAASKLDNQGASCQTSQMALSSLVPAPLLTLLLTITVPLSLLLLFGFKRSSHGKAHGPAPPSPSRIPIIGNLHQLGPYLHRSLHSLAQKHGRLMLIHMGQKPFLVVSSPTAAREILRTHDQVFAGRFVPKPAHIFYSGGSDLALLSYGERWRQLRRICTVHLLSSMRVQSYRRMMEDEVTFMIGKISAESATSPPAGIDMSEIMYSLTNDIICRAVSGKFSRKEGRNFLFRKLVNERLDLIGKRYVIGDLVPCLGWLDLFTGLLARTRKCRQKWDDLLDEVIKEHEARSKKGIRADEEKDFIDVLLSLRTDPGMDTLLIPPTIKSLLTDVFIGGTDTSYTTLEFALSELIRNPRVMKKLQEEVRGKCSTKERVGEKDVREMAYLKHVIKEVLRLHPPAPTLVPHQSTEDCEVQGYRVAKNTPVFFNVWAMARDPEHWEAPEEFKPERFVDSEVDYKGNDFKFIPFGAGRRICPGMQFATSAVELALANLVHHFDWDLPAGQTREEFHVDETPGIVARRQGRLYLVAKPWSGV